MKTPQEKEYREEGAKGMQVWEIFPKTPATAHENPIKSIKDAVSDFRIYSQYYAHTKPNAPSSEWQLLREHLDNTATLAADFASKFGAREWGEYIGLHHDLGKYSYAFQLFLRAQEEACAETTPGRVDHSSAGAQHVVNTSPILGHLIAYGVAGHHAGLLDGRSEQSDLFARLGKEIPSWEQGLTERSIPAFPNPPEFIQRAFTEKDAFSVSFFVRMLFSCLVDADFLDTEKFMNPVRFETRTQNRSLISLCDRFLASIDALEKKSKDTPVNRIRRNIRIVCEKAAEKKPGCFTLTVPTGGGKTLSSLAFSLRHARLYKMRRIVYVAPFTSIIEQNANVFRRHLGKNAIIEHHSNISPDQDTTSAHLAAENWDAPVIVTTAVQFYESLLANQTSRCRKLHRLARSIILLDEAQTLPVDCLTPCLRVLSELARNYGCTIVFCTATQPRIALQEDFDIGIARLHEIIPDPDQLYASLKRVKVKNLGKLSDAILRDRLKKEQRVLCIVNTTRHARDLFVSMDDVEDTFHLSARMCPNHRTTTLDQVRDRLETGRPCRLISTQVVEAGVDLDFPVVYRSQAGIDSIAQAAGRCNRNGLQREKGRVYVFQSEHSVSERFLRDTAQCGASIMDLYGDPLALAAIDHYFKLYYWDQKERWDAYGVVDAFRLVQNRKLPFSFDFRKVSQCFRMIDDRNSFSVVVPWGDTGQSVCKKLRSHPAPTRDLLRQAQRYVVQVRSHDWDQRVGRGITLLHERLGILDCPEICYDKQTGLHFETENEGHGLVV